MSSLPPGRTGARPHRGRPRGRGAGPRRRGAPTLARLLALRVLLRVERTRAYADLALHAALSQSSLVGADRALVTELVYGTLRWRGRLDFLLAKVLDRELEKLEPTVVAALRLGAYQIVFSERIPASAAVDESVRCVHALGAERAGGLVNAVLRRFASEFQRIPLPTLEEDPLAHLTHALSLPGWVAEALLEQFGAEEAAAIGKALTDVPPRTVRANPLRGSRDALLADLRERFPNAEACRLAPLGIQLGRRGDPGRDPAFLDGRCTVQDEAAQLVVELLAPEPGERVLDACAAPGAKATAIAERIGVDGQVLALDRHARRLGLLRRDARRLGLENVTTQVRDASASLDDLVAERGFDRVLVDAPCSGLGVLRRNPDARWRVLPGDVAKLARTQRAILSQAASCLRPGGTLVYSTCTLLREENEAVIESFLSERPEFRLVPAAELPGVVQPVVTPEGFLRCLPNRHDTDGFFAARLERRS
ncbi:MAG TPA: 16S rRNA (cytosine(967)-C(5))-methyltransferase RsmB [Myxococcota bacterium]|nr:16S rRNA (cytosine(967)-C(5))-methyltransferase RsmB [Myxococcota bacterium]